MLQHAGCNRKLNRFLRREFIHDRIDDPRAEGVAAANPVYHMDQVIFRMIKPLSLIHI